jgi:hypothetical protein
MKPPVIFSIITLAAMLPLRGQTWDPRAPFESPESIILQIGAADHAVIYPVGIGKGIGPITVKDRAWIRSIAQELHETTLGKSGQFLGVSTNVVFCDRNDKMLHELQVFPGRARLDGLDYSVDSITSATMGEMLRIQMDNDSPGPARPSK